MTIQELKNARAPFQVRRVHDDHEATIIGFSTNDPLGVGGGIIPLQATAYFEGGGWCRVKDLLKHWNIVSHMFPGEGNEHDNDDPMSSLQFL